METEGTEELLIRAGSPNRVGPVIGAAGMLVVALET